MSFARIARSLSRAVDFFHRPNPKTRLSLSLRRNWLLLLAVFSAGASSAQDISASIRGTIFDESAATVSVAKVTAINTDTGLQRAATTNSQGAYVLVELPVGHYRLEAEANGFKKYVQEGISLDVNQSATVPIHLTIGTTTQLIEVKADAPVIESTSTNLGPNRWRARDSRSSSEWAAIHTTRLVANRAMTTRSPLCGFCTTVRKVAEE